MKTGSKMNEPQWVPWNKLETPSALQNAGAPAHRVSRPEPRRQAIMASPKVLYILECGHVMPGRSSGIAKTECFECHAIKQIKGVHIFEWRASCKQPHCNYSRWTGLSRSLASYLVTQHLAKHQFHNTKLEYVKNPIAEKTEERLRKADIII